MASRCDFSNWKGSFEVSNLTNQLALRHSLFQQGNSIHLFPLEIWSTLEESFEKEMVSVIDLSANFCSGSCIEKPCASSAFLSWCCQHLFEPPGCQVSPPQSMVTLWAEMVPSALSEKDRDVCLLGTMEKCWIAVRGLFWTWEVWHASGLWFHSKQQCGVRLSLKGSAAVLSLPHTWGFLLPGWEIGYREQPERFSLDTAVKKNPLIMIDWINIEPGLIFAGLGPATL